MEECINIEFKEVGIRNLYLDKESTITDKRRFCHFHKSHGHNTDECLHLKDTLEELIKNGSLTRYIQEDGQKDDHGRKKEYRKRDDSP